MGMPHKTSVKELAALEEAHGCLDLVKTPATDEELLPLHIFFTSGGPTLEAALARKRLSDHHYEAAQKSQII